MRKRIVHNLFHADRRKRMCIPNTPAAKGMRQRAFNWPDQTTSAARCVTMRCPHTGSGCRFESRRALVLRKRGEVPLAGTPLRYTSTTTRIDPQMGPEPRCCSEATARCNAGKNTQSVQRSPVVTTTTHFWVFAWNHTDPRDPLGSAQRMKAATQIVALEKA